MDGTKLTAPVLSSTEYGVPIVPIVPIGVPVLTWRTGTNERKEGNPCPPSQCGAGYLAGLAKKRVTSPIHETPPREKEAQPQKAFRKTL
jgi:hypothetical protein